MLHTGHLQIEWKGFLEICFSCETCKPTVTSTTIFPEAEEALMFLIDSELPLPAGELAKGVRDAIARPRVAVSLALCLADEQLRTMFPTTVNARRAS
jgi:hypothetical protein